MIMYDITCSEDDYKKKVENETDKETEDLEKKILENLDKEFEATTVIGDDTTTKTSGDKK